MNRIRSPSVRWRHRRCEENKWVYIIPIIVSILAFVFSVWAYSDTRAVVKEFEKPILNIDDTKITAELLDNGDVKVNFLLLFKNYGAGVAQDARLRVYFSFVNQPELLTRVIDDTIANDIYPNVVFNRNIEFTIPSSNVNLDSKKISIKKENIPPIALVIRLDYKDKIKNKNESQTFWMGYQMGRAGAYHLSTEERNKLNSAYQKLI